MGAIRLEEICGNYMSNTLFDKGVNPEKRIHALTLKELRILGEVVHPGDASVNTHMTIGLNFIKEMTDKLPDERYLFNDRIE